MTTEYETRTTCIIVNLKTEPTFSEAAISVKIDDEGAGEFVRVEHVGGTPPLGYVLIDRDQWPMLRDAIDRMIADCRDND